MTWDKLRHWLVPALVFVGASALTGAIFALPDLGLAMLAALVGARVLMGVGWVLTFRTVKGWFGQQSPAQIASAL